MISNSHQMRRSMMLSIEWQTNSYIEYTDGRERRRTTVTVDERITQQTGG